MVIKKRKWLGMKRENKRGGEEWVGVRGSGYKEHQVTLTPQLNKYKWTNTEGHHPICIFQMDIKIDHFEKNKLDSMPRRNHTCLVRWRRKS